MTRRKNHHSDEPVEPSPPVDEPVAAAADAPEVTPLVAGPMPMGVGVMRVQKQRYRDWIAAGGTPPIYT